MCIKSISFILNILNRFIQIQMIKRTEKANSPSVLSALIVFKAYSTVPFFTASKSSSISFEGAFVRRETAAIRIEENMKAGRSS